jgi:adhesin transport system outer membrane protein
MAARPQALLVRALALLALSGGMAAHVEAETLPDVIRKALSSNPEVLTAKANKDASEKQIDQARAGYFPTLDVRAAGGREWSATPSLADKGVSLNRTENSLTAKQMLFDGGQVSAEVARQTEASQAAGQRLRDISATIGQRVSDIYLETLKNQELYELAKENLRIHGEYIAKMRERIKKGVGQGADLQLAEGREALASSTLTTREAAYEDARIRYKRLVGEPPRGLVEPESVSRTVPALIELAYEIAFDNNTSLAVAQADIEAARKAEEAARRKLSPTLSLELGQTRNRNMDGTAGGNSDRTAMLVMNYNLFRGGSDEARIYETGDRLTAAMETANNTRRTIEEEVGRAWVALSAAKASLEHLEQHFKRSQDVRVAYIAQFEIGKRTLIDLMNAESELFQARSNYVGGKYAVTQGEYRLLAGMGGLMKILGIEKVTPAPARAVVTTD